MILKEQGPTAELSGDTVSRLVSFMRSLWLMSWERLSGAGDPHGRGSLGVSCSCPSEVGWWPGPSRE